MPKPSSARRRSSRASQKKDLAAQLAQIESAQLVRRLDDSDLAYLFKHALTQETAYESLLLKTRREIHRRVAQAYEKIYAERLTENAALLAQHYAEAGDDAKTLEYATRAGDAAARVYATAEAIAQYTLALQVARRWRIDAARVIHLYIGRGRALELSSRFYDALQNYHEMAEVARERHDRSIELESLMARATLRSIPTSSHDPAQAQILSDQALALARELGDRRAEAKILWNIVLMNIYSGGDAGAAVAAGEHSIALARELGLREQLAYSLHDIFVAYAYLGEMERAVAARTEAAALWRELDNQPMLAENLSGLAMLYFMRAQYEQALAGLEEASEIGRAIGNLTAQGFSGFVSSFIFVERGEFGEALKRLERALPTSEQGEFAGPGTSVNGQFAWVFANLGEVAHGLELARVAQSRARTDIRAGQDWFSALLTRLYLLDNNVAAAEESFRAIDVTSITASFNKMFPLGAPVLFFAAAELALAQREYARAIQVMDELLAEFEKRQQRTFLAEALHLKALALQGLGESDQAHALLLQAHAIAERTGARRVHWQILATLAKAESSRGNYAQAELLLEQAREIIYFIAEHAGSPQLRASFLASSRVRALVQSVPESQ